MKYIRVWLGVLGLMISSAVAFGQAMTTSHVSAVTDAALALAGDNKAFSAKGVINIENKKKETATIKFDFAVADGNIRTDVDAANIEGAAIPESEFTQMKAMKKEKISTILRPDKNKRYTVYPDMRAYLDQALLGENETAPAAPKIEMTELEKETIDGHPCVKNKVTIAQERGRRQEFTVWSATDLKDFPIQIQYSAGGVQVSAKFTDIKLENPEDTDFNPPRRYMRCKTPMDLMGASMRRRE